MQKKQSLQIRIMKMILLLIFIPMMIIAIISIAQLSALSETIGFEGSESLHNENLKSMQNKTADAAIYLQDYLNKIEIDLDRLAAYETQIFGNTINSSNTRSSYHLTSGPTPSDLMYSNQYKRYISLNYSDYVNNTVVTGTVSDLVNRTAYMDYIADSILRYNSEYITIKMGFEAGFSRVFPFNSSLSRTSSSDMRAESWYIDAKSNAGKKIISNPLYTAIGPAIIMSRAVYNQTTLIGCIGLEVHLTTIRDVFRNITILKTGYAALVNLNGKALAHPQLGTSDYDATIESLESNPANFTGVWNIIKSKTVGSEVITKSSKEYVISYYSVGKFNLTTLAIAPNEEVLASGVSLRAALTNLTTPTFVTFIIVLIAVCVVMVFAVAWFAKRITAPIHGLTESVEKMTKGDLSNEISIDPRHRKNELGLLAQSFQSLLITMRMGNQSYYRGDLHLAYSNYMAALQLFETMNNKKGIGISLNNLGNIYRTWGDFEKAMESYNRSIAIAEELNDLNGLAARLNNRGLLYLNLTQWNEAKADFNKALKIDQELKNNDRVAMRKRNLGVLAILTNDLTSAKKFLNEAYEIDRSADFTPGLAEDYFQLGRCALHQNSYAAAEDHFKQALELAKRIENYPLIKNILSEMIKVYEIQKNAPLIEKAQIELNKINDVLVRKKNVIFVIDLSGSMQEYGKMKAVREGALEVYSSKINSQDKVAIIGFHSIVEKILSLTSKGLEEDKIRVCLQRLNHTPYQTAFYDAIGEGIDMLRTTPDEFQRWIVALTDGQDNNSTKYTPDNLAAIIKELGFPLNIILIGVGPELKDVSFHLLKIVNATPRGKYIPIYSTKNVAVEIGKAFKVVEEIMASSEIEGFAPEEK